MFGLSHQSDATDRHAAAHSSYASHIMRGLGPVSLGLRYCDLSRWVCLSFFHVESS